jgi:DNA-binding PucR family transcriptional regulator
VAAYRLLGSLPNLPDGPRLARGLLEPLLGGRPALVAERLATLRAVLDHPGLAEAAAMLGVHRNTVAYRVRRIESLGGWDLQDPELRLSLAIAIRIVQEAQSRPNSATS